MGAIVLFLAIVSVPFACGVWTFEAALAAIGHRLCNNTSVLIKY